MPAHSRSLVSDCQHPYCDRKATEQVYNTWNDARGKFCAKHAAEEVASLRKTEDLVKDAKWVKQGPSDTKVTF